METSMCTHRMDEERTEVQTDRAKRKMEPKETVARGFWGRGYLILKTRRNV